MDKDKISKVIAGILKMLVKATQRDRIDFDEDLAYDQILALIAPELEKAEKYDELYSAASDVMRCLNTFGAKIVPHLMDTDENPGQRLRDALNQPEVKP